MTTIISNNKLSKLLFLLRKNCKNLLQQIVESGNNRAKKPIKGENTILVSAQKIY